VPEGFIVETPNLPIRQGSLYRIANAHARNFGLNPNFTISGDTNSVSVAINSFRFVFVQGCPERMRERFISCTTERASRNKNAQYPPQLATSGLA
jgi:hypothetical protein